jgi:hypothetical protein
VFLTVWPNSSVGSASREQWSWSSGMTRRQRTSSAENGRTHCYPGKNRPPSSSK